MKSPAVPARKSGIVTFEPKARLLKLIGSELISDEVVAITELVKNAHDADATFVSIQFSASSSEDGEIFIRDDGHGMDLDALLTRWMQPAGSTKGRRNSRFTAGGRRMLGEKGVGRFATDKLGSKLELVSRASGSRSEVRAVFDWDEFEADEKMLSDVGSHWEIREPEWLAKQGTILRITGLRTRWNERMFRRLSARLSRLLSPVKGTTGFVIKVESDEFPQYSGEVSNGFLESAPYKVEAALDADGWISMSINGQSLPRARWTPGTLGCGPVRVSLLGFDLETEALARIGPRAEVRAWLREWSGVSVFRDGFRVWPYGEPHDDWLRLDQRRVNNPVVCMSNNQLVGFVEISADGNPALPDQTNREGLIHNDAFSNLQRFVLHVLHGLETARQTVRRPALAVVEKARSTTVEETTSTADQLVALAARAPSSLRRELRTVAARVRAQAGTADAQIQTVVRGYTEMAAIGIAAALLGKSISCRLEEMRDALEEVWSAARSSGTKASALKASFRNVDGIMDLALESMASFGNPGGAGGRRRGLDVAAELKKARDTLGPALSRENVDFSTSSSRSRMLRTEMRPEVFAALLSLLLRAALDQRSSKAALSVDVTARGAGSRVQLEFRTRGDRAVNFGRRTVVNGADALGLAAGLVTAHSGLLEVVSAGRGGASSVRVLLPMKRSRATK